MVTRRNFIEGAGGLVGAVAVGLPAWAEGSAVSEASFVPCTSAGELFANAIREKNDQDLCVRMGVVNRDVREHGLRTMPGVEGKLLTGYPYKPRDKASALALSHVNKATQKSMLVALKFLDANGVID